MAMDYSTMWEAFVSGEGWADQPFDPADTPYQARVQEFYTDIIGPAFGYEGDGFGEAFGEKLSIGGERYELDRAERQFRLAIGDPYGTDDPFAWETLSRYATGSGPLTEAQKLLEGELYEKGGLLGGETGSAYGLSMEGQEEAYTTGMTGQREAISYGALTAGAGLASGASGATLRSGAAVGQAEDILSEAYKEARGIGEGYILGKAKTEDTLKGDLDEAFKVYTDTIREEKEGFLQNILKDVQILESYQGSSILETGASAAETAFGSEEAIAKFEELRGTADWSGLTYEGELEADPTKAFEFREDEACGIGMLYNPDTQLCEVFDEELAENAYKELYGTGEGFEDMYDCAGVFGGSAVVDECGECGGDGSSCADDCTEGYDACGVCGGDNSSCADCAGTPNGSAEVDECNVCEGTGGDVVCEDGSMVCVHEQCPEVVEPSCPQGTEWNGTYSNDPGNMCDPIGDPEVGLDCPPDQEQVNYFGVDVCIDKAFEDLCDDGSERPPNGVCPEDLEGDCPCRHSLEWDEKGQDTVNIWYYDCPGDPRDGTICGSEGDVTTGRRPSGGG